MRISDWSSDVCSSDLPPAPCFRPPIQAYFADGAVGAAGEAVKDYYDTLGVQRDADAAALKAAYRKLAMQYHPDRNPGDTTAEARFKEINEAYEVLKDSKKRATYDRFGPERSEEHTAELQSLMRHS